jgi:hypothetical protein
MLYIDGRYLSFKEYNKDIVGKYKIYLYEL